MYKVDPDLLDTILFRHYKSIMYPLLRFQNRLDFCSATGMGQSFQPNNLFFMAFTFFCKKLLLLAGVLANVVFTSTSCNNLHDQLSCTDLSLKCNSKSAKRTTFIYFTTNKMRLWDQLKSGKNPRYLKTSSKC